MKDNNFLLKLFLYSVLFSILLPIVILIIWSFTGQWPWPNLLPTNYSLRAIKELFAPYAKVIHILLSSMAISFAVAILSAIIGILTSRALVYYDFWGKSLITILSISPNLIPSTVFAMGVHTLFIRLSLTNTVLGVIVVHLIYTLPYSVSIMRDLTESIGIDMELQAYVLGASPVRSFFHISLPLLVPGILASISMAYITSFSQYFLTLLIGGGEVQTFSLIMVPLIAKGDRAISSTYSLMFLVSTLVIFKLIGSIINSFTNSNKRRKI